MDKKVYYNYVHTTKLDIDIDKMRESCGYMYSLVNKNFSKNKLDFNEQSTPVTQLFASYNLLMYPFDGFHELYEGIRKEFRELGLEGNYYIQCWLNYYNEGQCIDWHDHWDEDCCSWHGYYCVDVEPSKTTYRIEGLPELDIISENNLLVLSPSGKDKHRTWPWHDKTRPRVTIAFDILPGNIIDPNNNFNLNHWVPL